MPVQSDLNGSIVAIGNAPTALLSCSLWLTGESADRPLVVGTPVGFVGAAESKQLLVEQEAIPYISLLGTRGRQSHRGQHHHALLYSKGV